MKRFLFFFFFSTAAFAQGEVFEAKKGFVLGLGLTGSRYLYPAEYEGSQSDKLDDKMNLIGGAAQLGYDFLLFQRLILGLRTEGMILDNLGSGNKSDNRLNGRLRAIHALLRLGGVFEVKTFDPVGDPARMSLEIFLEGGPTSGKRNVDKIFEASNGDGIDESLSEEYQGNVIGGGLNLTNRGGAFFELKAQHTTLGSNVRRFTGTKTEGGSPTSVDRKDEDKKNFTIYLMVLGQKF